VNDDDDGSRLPLTVGGLLGFALSAFAANARFYVALQVGVFAAYALAETVVPAAVASTPQGHFKGWVLLLTGLFADAFVTAAVAMGVAARSAGTRASARALTAIAIERWLPVIIVSFLALYLVMLTNDLSGLGAPSEPRALAYATAPLIWIFWGILGLTGPFVALSADRRSFAVFAGFAHAFTTSLRRGNLMRLCVLAVVTVMPTVLQGVAFNLLVAHHVTRPLFWAEVPIDALTVGPLAAIQTAFALDFARRASAQRSA